VGKGGAVLGDIEFLWDRLLISREVSGRRGRAACRLEAKKKRGGQDFKGEDQITSK